MAGTGTTKAAAFLSLFVATGTLMCCALPALLVTLGMGAALAGLVSTVPAITLVSEHKDLVFAVAGSMLLGAWLLERRARAAACPTDPEQAAACQSARRGFPFMLTLATVMCAAGGFFAYLAPRLL